ncbi:signal peptidase I [Terrimicrobium sacchariphilum]|uniref:Signal peptidase I n=1 Tax=Terrimicrobium sacchariphilum TaxID=690879 RepID=A0A146G9M3_TERSA|nr:signal peptidase I [Terrimicrobium sacchariphilum]GAT33962.1 signal peptidase I [Terrimicrobium sacchariphilum]
MFFTPRHIKEGKHYRHAVRRLIHYKEDILSEADLDTLRELEAAMTAALKTRKREEIGKVIERIDKQVGRIVPPLNNAGLRENVEVFVVAIVIAAGVRAYFLQPFKIPTGSMQPTLYGIVANPQDSPPPNILKRAFEFVWLGRSYFNEVATSDDIILTIKEKTYLNFFTFTDITGENSRYTVFAPEATLRSFFGLSEQKLLRKGEPIVRGYVDTGDQVFVDKMSYNFVPPQRGNVFVFKTTGISGIRMPQGVDSQHYIKRLAGMPGDTLRIAAPQLFINGASPSEWVFQRVIAAKDGYQGYSNFLQATYLQTPESTFRVPEQSYFALGDNSYHSSDSRFWGPVPEQNVAGRGLFVYWPFSKRWGLIH